MKCGAVSDESHITASRCQGRVHACALSPLCLSSSLIWPTLSQFKWPRAGPAVHCDGCVSSPSLRMFTFLPPFLTFPKPQLDSLSPLCPLLNSIKEMLMLCLSYFIEKFRTQGRRVPEDSCTKRVPCNCHVFSF